MELHALWKWKAQKICGKMRSTFYQCVTLEKSYHWVIMLTAHYKSLTASRHQIWTQWIVYEMDSELQMLQSISVFSTCPSKMLIRNKVLYYLKIKKYIFTRYLLLKELLKYLPWFCQFVFVELICTHTFLLVTMQHYMIFV